MRNISSRRSGLRRKARRSLVLNTRCTQMRDKDCGMVGPSRWKHGDDSRHNIPHYTARRYSSMTCVHDTYDPVAARRPIRAPGRRPSRYPSPGQRPGEPGANAIRTPPAPVFFGPTGQPVSAPVGTSVGPLGRNWGIDPDGSPGRYAGLEYLLPLRGGHGGPPRPAFIQNPPIGSPPLGVPNACHVARSIVFGTNRTLPSHKAAFTPPGW